MTELSLENSLYSIPFNRLKLMGAWVVDSRNNFVLNAYSFYKTVMTAAALAGCVSLFYDFYMVMGNFKKLTWNLCISTLFTGSLIKNIYMIHKCNVINRLRVRLHNDDLSRRSREDVVISQSSLREMKSVRRFFYLVAFVFIPTWLLSFYFSSMKGGVKDIPIPLRIPIDIDYNDHFQYNIAFILVGIGGIMGISLVLQTELAMFTLLVQISREYKRLLKDIANINELYLSNKVGFDVSEITKEINPVLRKMKTKVLVKEYSTRQQQLIQYTKDFELSYSLSLLLHIFVMTVLTVVSAIQCILDYGNVSVNLSYQMGYICALGMDMFLVCWYASKIKSQCLKVGESAYFTQWYEMDPDIQKDVYMMIMRSQRPPKITSGKVMELNLPAFMVLIKNIYSWLTLFQQLEFKINE